MWGAIISGVTSLASSYMDNRKVKAQHKSKIEQARLNAEINRIEKAAQSDQDYDIKPYDKQDIAGKMNTYLSSLPYLSSGASSLIYKIMFSRDGNT